MEALQLPETCMFARETRSANLAITRPCTCVSDLGARRSLIADEALGRLPYQRPVLPHGEKQTKSAHSGGAVL